MPFLRRFAPAAVRRGRRRSAADVQRVLHPGGALVLHDVDGAFVFALRAALAMGLVAVPVVLAGRPDLAVYAMLGSFTSTFGRNLPYARRARVLALVALAMTACVACGSALAAWARPEESAAGAAVVVAATALVAGVAKYVCDATRLSGLGAVMVLFSFAVAAHASPAPADILPYTAMAAAGAAPAWILGMLGLLIHPDRPQRLAVATALRRVAALLEARAAGTEVPGRTRHRATVAVLDAYRSLGQPPPARRTVPRHDTLLLRSADRSWALLVGAARWAPGEQRSAALHLRGQARLLTGRRHGIPRYPVRLDNLSAHKGDKIRRWAKKNRVELCSLRPTTRGPTRSKPISATAAVHDRQLPPPQPQRANPGPARLPAPAKHQQPPPRHPRGAASRTCPHPKREGHPLGRTSLAVAT